MRRKVGVPLGETARPWDLLVSTHTLSNYAIYSNRFRIFTANSMPSEQGTHCKTCIPSSSGTSEQRCSYPYKQYSDALEALRCHNAHTVRIIKRTTEPLYSRRDWISDAVSGISIGGHIRNRVFHLRYKNLTGTTYPMRLHGALLQIPRNTYDFVTFSELYS